MQEVMTPEGEVVPKEIADEVLWRQVHSRRLDQLAKCQETMQERQEAMQTGLDENTKTTLRIEQSTKELVHMLESWKGAMRVLEVIGKVAKPIGYIASAVTAVWAMLHFGGSK